jgi:hypothetical protein
MTAVEEPNWTRSVEALLAEYRRVDRESLRLPALGWVPGVATLSPFPQLQKDVRKVRAILAHGDQEPYEVGRELTLREWLREGHAFYRYWTRDDSPTQDMLAFWRGEAALLSEGTVSRPLVSSLLAAHFRRRLVLLRRWILLEWSEGAGRQALLKEVEDALEIWRTRRSLSGVITFLISVLGTVGGLLSIANGVRDLPWYGWVATGILVFLAYLFVVGSFVAKRGLMLGGSAKTQYVPSRIEGRGVYGLERQVFDPLGVKRSEIPFDLVLADLFIALWAAFFFAIGLGWVGVVIGSIFLAALLANIAAYVRRSYLQRL